MKQLSPRRVVGSSRSQKESSLRLSKQSSGSSTTGETDKTCSTIHTRSRTPSPQQQRSRGMDPGGLIVIPRRKSTLNDKSAKADVAVAAAATTNVIPSDKEVTWNELPTTEQQQHQQESAIVVASSTTAVVTPPPSIPSRRSHKTSSSDKDEKKKDTPPQIKETALTLYNNDNKAGRKANSKSAVSTSVVDKERVRVDTTATNKGRQYRTNLWSTSKGNNIPPSTSSSGQRSSSKSRAAVTTTSRDDDHGGVDDSNNHRGSNEDDVGRKEKSKTTSKSSRGNVKKSSSNDAGGEGGKNRKGGETKEQPDKIEGGVSSDKPATKRDLSRKKSQQLNSISGSREAIRSFSRTKSKSASQGWKSKRQGDGDDAKKPSWKDSIGTSSPEKSNSLMKRLGSKISGKTTTTTTTTAEKKEVVASTETPTNAAAAAPTTKNRFASRGKARGIKSLPQQKAASKTDVRIISPPSQDIRRRPSLSPNRGNDNKRSVSPRRPSSRESSRSRSRSPSPSPRRSRRSLSPHSSRASFSSRSRSPSPRHRRPNSPRRYSSSSRSRSPSPRRRRSMSSNSSYSSSSRSRSPSRSRTPPRRRLRRSVSPPSPRYGSRRGGRFHSRSRTPSPRRMREFGGARRRSPPRRANQFRRGSFHSQSPPRERRPNVQIPMRRQSSVPRGPSFPSRGQSPPPRGGRRQMSAQGNQYQNRGNPGPNRRPQRQMSPPNGRLRRGSSSPLLNRSFSHIERDGRRNSDFAPRARGAPIGSTRRRPALQRRGSFENRGRMMPAPTRSLSPPRMRPQSQQRQLSDGYKRHVSRGLAPIHAVESQALVVRDQSPPTEELALVPRVESQSSLRKQDPRRSSTSTESTGVWIDCPKQNYDPCDDDLTFSECQGQGLRDEDSYATYDATHGLPPPGPSSVAQSFATYEVLDGPPTASDRKVDLQKWTKPRRNNSKAADLAVMSKIAEDGVAQTLGERGIARKASAGSLPSLAKKQGSPFVPGPPPKKPVNVSFASASEPPRALPRPKSPELVRNNTSSVGNGVANIESNVLANHQKAPGNDPPYSRRSSPPPPPPRSSESPIETLQPVPSIPFQDMFQGPTVENPTVENNWRQYLTRGNRNTSNCRGPSRSISPVRDTSRGRASSTGRSVASRERSLSAGRAGERLSKMFGRAPEKLDNNDRQVNNVVNDMPFRDQFGDCGLYRGQVNEQGRPNGKGSMKYDNGIFYEGMWTDGCQDELAATQYHRVRSGFTSWKGKGKAAVKSGKTLPWNANKKDKYDENDKTHVRGMEWIDLNGDSGRYTGEVSKDEVPHGKGIMKYDFGLIAEGDWVNGMLKENPLDRMLSAAALNSSGQGANAMSIMSSARSLYGGSLMSNTRSLGTTVNDGSLLSMSARSFGTSGHGSLMSFRGASPAMQMNPMMNPMANPMMMMQSQPPPMMVPQPNNGAAQQQVALIAHQNAMLMQARAMYGGGGPPMVQMPPPQQQMMPMQQPNTTQVDPPVAEIKFS